MKTVERETSETRPVSEPLDLIRASHRHFAGKSDTLRNEAGENNEHPIQARRILKLFVIGATGRTGGEIVQQALANGHSVTAFVRSPEKIVLEHKLPEAERA